MAFTPTSEQLDAYVRLLKDREARLRADLRVKEKSLNRIQRKLLNPIPELRKDVKEGVASVCNAIGVPVPPVKQGAPATKESALVTGETHEMNLNEPAAAPAKKKGFFDELFED